MFWPKLRKGILAPPFSQGIRSARIELPFELGIVVIAQFLGGDRAHALHEDKLLGRGG